MTAKAAVDIVVLNFNGERDTAECLGSLEKMSFKNWRVILVDNGSTDGSGLRLKESFPKAEFIANGRNLGFAGGCNTGISRSLQYGRASHILLLNNDAVADARSLEELLGAFETDPAAGIAGAVNMYYDSPGKVQMAAHRFIWWLGIQSVARSLKTRFQPVQSVSGSSMLVKKEVFEKVGLLDERFFVYYDEADLCLRARRAGFKVYAARDARVLHKVNRVIGSHTAGEYYIYTRNQPLFMLKNCPKLFLLDYFLLYFIKVFARIIYFSAVSRRDISAAIWRGFSDFFRGNFGEGRLFAA